MLIVDFCLIYIQSLSEMLTNSRVNIGIKRMGEIDDKAFKNACKKRYPQSPTEEADLKAVELVSLWQEKVKNLEWHPFRVVEDDKGNAKVDSLKSLIWIHAMCDCVIII